MAQMEHWSKTSSVEPLPVGRHKKRNKEVDYGFRFNGDYACRTKFQKTVKVYHVFQGSHGAFMRPIDAERNRTSNIGHRKQSRIGADHIVKDYKGKCCLKPTPFPEKDGTTTKSRIQENHVQEANSDKTEMRLIMKKEKAPFSSTSTSGQRTERKDNWLLARKKLKAILYEFRAYCNDLLEQDKKKRDFKRVDCIAAKLIKRKYGYPHKAFLGSIPGVEIGDRFNYRMELHVLGLHRPPQGGIDSMETRGRRIAISVVDSGEYDNYMSNQETLIYCGEGGNGGRKCSKEDQKLIRGNLALKNSIKAKNPVRVIRGSKVLNSPGFFYDGLYTVEKMWKEINQGGYLIFKYELVRMPGQPSSLPRRNF